MAVGRDHKLSGGKPVPGNVGHDRIQQASGDRSIGEAIRYWYGLKTKGDFERIDVDVRIHYDRHTKKEHFILTPTEVRMREKSRKRDIPRVMSPLSFHDRYQSELWRKQIDFLRSNAPYDVRWAASQINRVVAENRKTEASHILEADLLRAAGALSILGLELGPYLGKGYDCMDSSVQFNGLPLYPCPVEVKRRSRGFNYQVERYEELPRAVVLCIDHDLPNPPEDIDVLALPTLGQYLGR
jgi:hypothetical protein